MDKWANNLQAMLDLLLEGQQKILKELTAPHANAKIIEPRIRVDELEEEVKFLKSIIHQMNEDLQTLKKAN